MTTRRVTILCLDGGQKAAVSRILIGPVEANGDYLLGLADEEGQDKLEAGGYLYSLADVGEPTAATVSVGNVERTLDDSPEGDDDSASGRILLDLADASSPQLLHDLKKAGVTLSERVGPASYVAAYQGHLDPLRGIAEVNAVAWYGQTATLRAPELIPAAHTARQAPSVDRGGISARLARRIGGPRSIDEFGDGPAALAPHSDNSAFQLAEDDGATVQINLVPFDVRCHADAEIAACAATIEAIPGVARIDRIARRIRFWTLPDAAASIQREVAGLPQTMVVEPYVAPEILLDQACAALWGGAERPAAGPWTGAGEVVAVADTGIDQRHPDFGARVRLIGPTNLPADRDPNGHGTHVASIIAGDGSASGGVLTGVAPHADLLVQRLGARLEALATVDSVALFQAAYDEGARIHNLSWGSAVESSYVLNCDDLDSFVAKHPDFLIVVACGNSGVQDIMAPGKPIGTMSLNAPGNAKNCLSVGACCSPRQDGPYKGLPWARYDGVNPPNAPPMSTLPLTGDDSIVAASSSRGPTDDNRVKPDLVAVGIGVAAARSADRGQPIKPWGDDGRYMYLSGTSMAAPLVSGAAALVRHYLREKRQHLPSAALVKAILINGARWLPGPQQEDATIGQPNYHQGHGRLELPLAFPLVEGGGFRLNFTDIADTDPAAVRMKEVAGPPALNWRGSFTVLDDVQPLSVTLCWTDPPGRGPQHDLDLAIIAPGGSFYAGNNLLARVPGRKTDIDNNVERIVIAAPTKGDWVVMVQPRNTFRHPQGFALAVTGAIGDWIP